MGVDQSHIWHTGFEHWPDELIALGLPRETISMSREDIVFMGAQTPGFLKAVDAKKPNGFSDVFVEELEAALEVHPQGSHLRLGICSFKAPLRPAQKVFALLDTLPYVTRPNPRVASLLRPILSDKHPCALYALPWEEMQRWSEFRIFIKENTIYGVSQYHTNEVYQEIAVNADAIQDAIAAFCSDLLGALHMTTVVADIFLRPGPDNSLEPVLIELNPFIQRTDACLYSWDKGGDFDGAFRFRAN